MYSECILIVSSCIIRLPWLWMELTPKNGRHPGPFRCFHPTKFLSVEVANRTNYRAPTLRLTLSVAWKRFVYVFGSGLSRESEKGTYLDNDKNLERYSIIFEMIQLVKFPLMCFKMRTLSKEFFTLVTLVILSSFMDCLFVLFKSEI